MSSAGIEIYSSATLLALVVSLLDWIYKLKMIKIFTN